MQIVAVDIMGPFLKGKTHILVASDYFTRWAEAYAIPNLEETTVSSNFRCGSPEQLHADQGRDFESSIMAEVCKTLRISNTRTTPYHPQLDGLVERLNTPQHDTVGSWGPAPVVGE